MGKNLIVILGPTASGKTSLAARLAYDLDGEMISADSRQVYRGMDIGTGKDINQCKVAETTIPVHLIDILDPNEEFTVYDFQRLFYETFKDIRKREKQPILVGGTGLYLESVLCGYQMPDAPRDEELRKELAGKTLAELQTMLLSLADTLHNRTDLLDRERILRRIEIEQAKRQAQKRQDMPDLRAIVFGIRLPRFVVRDRIARRLSARLEEGMIEEVSRLHTNGLSWDRLDSFGLEYRFISRYLKGDIPKQEMIEKLAIAIGQFAKRQETWFRRMERKGREIIWIDSRDYEALKSRALEAIHEP